MNGMIVFMVALFFIGYENIYLNCCFCIWAGRKYLTDCLHDCYEIAIHWHMWLWMEWSFLWLLFFWLVIEIYLNWCFCIWAARKYLTHCLHDCYEIAIHWHVWLFCWNEWNGLFSGCSFFYWLWKYMLNCCFCIWADRKYLTHCLHDCY